MKSVFLIIITCIFYSEIYSQSFTESAFNSCKSVVDTSESIDMIQLCSNTFERILNVSQNDSLLLFYSVLCQTKMAYLSLQTNTLYAINYLKTTRTQLNYLDTTFRFGIETEIIKLFQTIITLKSNNNRFNEINSFENEIKGFYLNNKKTARGNLVYAFYLYHFKKSQKKVTESLLKTSLVLFEKEESLKLPINWGKHLAKSLFNNLKQMN
jgi:hypothetical protein